MTTARYCYIISDYYIENPDLQKVLDMDDVTKCSVRTHLCLNIRYNNLTKHNEIKDFYVSENIVS